MFKANISVKKATFVELEIKRSGKHYLLSAERLWKDNHFGALLRIVGVDGLAGFILRWNREKKSLPISQLARSAKLSPNTIVGLEAGRLKFKAKHLAKLNKIFPRLKRDLESVGCLPTD